MNGNPSPFTILPILYSPQTHPSPTRATHQPPFTVSQFSAHVTPTHTCLALQIWLVTSCKYYQTYLSRQAHIHGCTLSPSLPPRWPSGKASASRVEGLGFESRLRGDFFGVESYRGLKNWHSSGYPARRLALWGQRWEWSARCQYTVTG